MYNLVPVSKESMTFPGLPPEEEPALLVGGACSVRVSPVVALALALAAGLTPSWLGEEAEQPMSNVMVTKIWEKRSIGHSHRYIDILMSVDITW